MRAGAALSQSGEVDDIDLVAAWQRGEPEAYDRVYRRYFPALVRHLRPLAGDGAAEDLAQEVMIRALRHLDRHDGSRPLWPWLRRIATNVAIDAARQRTRGDALVAALSAAPDVHRTAAPADRGLVERDLLARALDEVPARQRDALARCYVEDARPVEAASELGLSGGAFTQLLHRARRNLRTAYLRHDDQPAAHDRAAHLGWLLGLAAWWAGLPGRVRQAAAAMPRAGEAAVASVAASVALVLVPAVVPGGGPAAGGTVVPAATGVVAAALDGLGAPGPAAGRSAAGASPDSAPAVGAPAQHRRPAAGGDLQSAARPDRLAPDPLQRGGHAQGTGTRGTRDGDVDPPALPAPPVQPQLEQAGRDVVQAVAAGAARLGISAAHATAVPAPGGDPLSSPVGGPPAVGPAHTPQPADAAAAGSAPGGAAPTAPAAQPDAGAGAGGAAVDGLLPAPTAAPEGTAAGDGLAAADAMAGALEAAAAPAGPAEGAGPVPAGSCLPGAPCDGG